MFPMQVFYEPFCPKVLKGYFDIKSFGEMMVGHDVGFSILCNVHEMRLHTAQLHKHLRMCNNCKSVHSVDPESLIGGRVSVGEWHMCKSCDGDLFMCSPSRFLILQSNKLHQ